MANPKQLKENLIVGTKPHFWTTLFEQEQLAFKLEKLENAIYPSSIHLSDYGHLKVTVARATTVGDGFLSDTYTVNCTRINTNETHYAFIKILSSNPYIRASALSLEVFDREEGNYRQLHSLLRSIIADAGFSNDDIPLNVPDIYYTYIEPGKTALIVMEDLKASGYSMISKWDGCNIDQARATLSSLANFHALGTALVRQHKTPEGEVVLPDAIRFIQQKSVMDESLPKMFGPSLPIFPELFKKLQDMNLAFWFEKESLNADVLIPEDGNQCGALTCILHADVWPNNMMFRIDEDGKVQMRLIDWQITRLGHAVTDVLYFLFISLSPELRSENFNELVNYYFRTLKDSLRKLGINLENEGYSDKEFQQDLRKRLHWILLFSMMGLPIILDKVLVDQIVNYDSEDVEHLTSKDSKAEGFSEMVDKFKDSLQLDKILANKVLCHRLIQVAREIKAILEQ